MGKTCEVCDDTSDEGNGEEKGPEETGGFLVLIIGMDSQQSAWKHAYNGLLRMMSSVPGL